MATVHEQLFALLGPVVGVGKLFDSVAPQPVPEPTFVIFQRISGTPNTVMAGNGGTGSPQNSRFQIDVYSKTRAVAVAVAATIVTAMQGWVVQNVPLSVQDLHEPDTKLFRTQMDFSVWHY